MRARSLLDRWPARAWLLGGAALLGCLPVVLGFTDRNHCSDADPGCVFHHYTAVQLVGPWAVLVLAAPLLMTVVLAVALHVKVAHRSARASRLAWWLAVLCWVACFAALLVVGAVALPVAPLTTAATAMTSFPPAPDDPLARPDTGYFGSRASMRAAGDRAGRFAP